MEVHVDRPCRVRVHGHALRMLTVVPVDTVKVAVYMNEPRAMPVRPRESVNTVEVLDDDQQVDEVLTRQSWN